VGFTHGCWRWMSGNLMHVDVVGMSLCTNQRLKWVLLPLSCTARHFADGYRWAVAQSASGTCHTTCHLHFV